MGDPNPTDGELDSIFDAPSAAEGAEGPPEPAAAPADDLAGVVAAYLPLDRRRVHGDPPLAPAEEARWRELREWLEYQFGAGNPPLAGSRRRSLRVPTAHKVAVAGAATEVANLYNLSHEGAFVEIPDPLAVGARLEITIDVDGGSPLPLTAVVRWCREIGNMDGPAGVGVEFTEIEDGDFAALEQLVRRTLESIAAKGA